MGLTVFYFNKNGWICQVISFLGYF
jgi:hypothetical protein